MLGGGCRGALAIMIQSRRQVRCRIDDQPVSVCPGRRRQHNSEQPLPLEPRYSPQRFFDKNLVHKMTGQGADVPRCKVNDLISRFEKLRPDDDLKRHSQLLRNMEEQYRSKHAHAVEKLSERDRELAEELQVRLFRKLRYI
jgi:hypothetical protein